MHTMYVRTYVCMYVYVCMYARKCATIEVSGVHGVFPEMPELAVVEVVDDVVVQVTAYKIIRPFKHAPQGHRSQVRVASV